MFLVEYQYGTHLVYMDLNVCRVTELMWIGLKLCELPKWVSWIGWIGWTGWINRVSGGGKVILCGEVVLVSGGLLYLRRPHEIPPISLYSLGSRDSTHFARFRQFCYIPPVSLDSFILHRLFIQLLTKAMGSFKDSYTALPLQKSVNAAREPKKD